MTKGTVSRRSALMGVGALGVAGAVAVGSKPAGAQGAVTLRWWSTQSVPAQLEAYKFQIAQFEAANPGIKVVFEPTSNETYPAQLAAAFASGQVPNIVTHLPSFAVTNYWRNGLLEPFNDVIQAIGAGEVLSRRQPHLRGRARAVLPAPASAAPPPTCCGCAPT